MIEAGDGRADVGVDRRERVQDLLLGPLGIGQPLLGGRERVAVLGFGGLGGGGDQIGGLLLGGLDDLAGLLFGFGPQ